MWYASSDSNGAQSSSIASMKIFGRKNQEGVLIKAPDQKLECEEKWSLQLLHESTEKLQMLLEKMQMNF